MRQKWVDSSFCSVHILSLPPLIIHLLLTTRIFFYFLPFLLYLSLSPSMFLPLSLYIYIYCLHFSLSLSLCLSFSPSTLVLFPLFLVILSLFRFTSFHLSIFLLFLLIWNKTQTYYEATQIPQFIHEVCPEAKIVICQPRWGSGHSHCTEISFNSSFAGSLLTPIMANFYWFFAVSCQIPTTTAFSFLPCLISSIFLRIPISYLFYFYFSFASLTLSFILINRRLAAVGVATRVAEEMACPIGDQVGYMVRGDSKATARTRIVFCTYGVLLRRLQVRYHLFNIYRAASILVCSYLFCSLMFCSVLWN